MRNPVDVTAEQLLPLMRGNASAAQFLAMTMDALHLWDDLIDRDKDVVDATIHRAFYAMLVLLPRNAFYNAHFDHLNPILVNAITNWNIANEFERGTDEYQLRIAYILRSSYCDLITQCAFLIGGVDYAVEVGIANRLNAHKETWGGYVDNLAAEKAARNSKE